ncbi:MAG: hypothetical protein DSM106950_46595, partial [Stigonema ocellatum SAG 48.90 = DSM 106950]|nr:hypothetical protein [Stigonema ocellatum SAG 48.90 = DSM 106950]
SCEQPAAARSLRTAFHSSMLTTAWSYVFLPSVAQFQELVHRRDYGCRGVRTAGSSAKLSHRLDHSSPTSFGDVRECS